MRGRGQGEESVAGEDAGGCTARQPLTPHPGHRAPLGASPARPELDTSVPGVGGWQTQESRQVMGEKWEKSAAKGDKGGEIGALGF